MCLQWVDRSRSELANPVAAEHKDHPNPRTNCGMILPFRTSRERVPPCSRGKNDIPSLLDTPLTASSPWQHPARGVVQTEGGVSGPTRHTHRATLPSSCDPLGCKRHIPLPIETRVRNHQQLLDTKATVLYSGCAHLENLCPSPLAASHPAVHHLLLERSIDRAGTDTTGFA